MQSELISHKDIEYMDKVKLNHRIEHEQNQADNY